MCRLRVLSWNIRTFGTHVPNAVDLARIAAIIRDSEADIVCIQELQIGPDVVGEVGAPISDRSSGIISDLVEALRDADLGANWEGRVSGVDSGIGDYMRDAYAFLWKATPVGSTHGHDKAVDQVEGLTEPRILRQEGFIDAFPGRRPGMIIFNVTSGGKTTPVNVISYHAPTPCNRFSKGVGSGYGINALATLPEIGGGQQVGDGRKWWYEPEVTALPQIDTLVVGDFNYTMDDGWAQFTYNNLLTNYEGCVSTPGDVVRTTYAPSPRKLLERISAYDNIFLLKRHKKFTPNLVHLDSGCIDFIAQDAKRLGRATKFEIGRRAWFVVHRDQYKKQHSVRGISDHLPVWSEFELGVRNATAQHIRPTCGEDNNCLFHALVGALVNGIFVNPHAGENRLALVRQLRDYRFAAVFPSALMRNAILSSMIEDLVGDPYVVLQLQLLLANNRNPFEIDGFPQLFEQYTSNIAHGRMLYVHEAELLAILAGITVVLHYVDRGQFLEQVLNPGHGNPTHIYHQALHFSRWA